MLDPVCTPHWPPLRAAAVCGSPTADVVSGLVANTERPWVCGSRQLTLNTQRVRTNSAFLNLGFRRKHLLNQEQSSTSKSSA